MTDSTIASPFLNAPGALWLRGNLHTHTTRSDGNMAPQDAIDRYAGLGYDFLALSDHDCNSDYGQLDARGMTLVPAAEVSAGGSHLLAIGMSGAPAPHPERQQVLDAIVAASGLAVLCHPNWERHFNHCDFGQMTRLSGYAGVEIFNGGCLENTGSALATDKWDRLLGSGRAVWGLATDDAHSPHEIGRGWCMVQAVSRRLEDILAALRDGSFYASSGVEIAEIDVEGETVRLVAPTAEAIVVIGDSGQRLAFVESSEISYQPAPTVDYFRIECLGRAGRMAWTQCFTRHSPETARRRELLRERVSLRLPLLARAPRLTGDLADPLWRQAGFSDRFLHSETGLAAAPATTLRCLAADGKLFLAVECQEPSMERQRLRHRAGGVSAIWTDDSVEIFIDPDGAARAYAHIMVGATGACYAAWHGSDAAGRPALRPEVRVARAAERWTAEVALPLTALGKLPEAGAPWGLNVVRNRYVAGTQRYTWSFLGASGNHAPDRFGLLERA